MTAAPSIRRTRARGWRPARRLAAALRRTFAPATAPAPAGRRPAAAPVFRPVGVIRVVTPAEREAAGR